MAWVRCCGGGLPSRQTFSEIISTPSNVAKTQQLAISDINGTITIVGRVTFSSSHLGATCFANSYVNIGGTRYTIRDYITSGNLGQWATEATFLISVPISANSVVTIVVNEPMAGTITYYVDGVIAK